MPKAEVGSTKYLSNKMKSKGLQRLRWYCQVCQRQMRDENGFKMHTQSEGHVRQMLVVGENAAKFIDDYSRQFVSDFIGQLKTAHGEKRIAINHFYQEYIANKEHVHMSATKWSSLTEFAKYLGKEGICRVDEDEKGIHVSWIDDSPEALKRQEALRRKEMMDKGDEEREQMMLREQIRRAKADAEARGAKVGDDDEDDEADADDPARELRREEGEKIKLSFGALSKPKPGTKADGSREESGATKQPPGSLDDEREKAESDAAKPPQAETQGSDAKPASSGLSLKLGPAKPQPKNVFAAAKNKNALGGSSTKKAVEPPKKMSEAERIMKEELEWKRSREDRKGQDGGPAKKIRF